MKTMSAALSLILVLQPLAQAQVVTGRAAGVPLAPALGLPTSPSLAPSALPATSLTPSVMTPSLAAPSAAPLPNAMIPAALAAKPVIAAAAAKAMEPVKPNVEPARALPVLRAAASTPEKPADAQFDGTTARKPASDDSSAPVAGAETPAASGLSLPVKTFTLANGLKVVVHTDKTAPVVAVSITYNVGSMHETPGLSGFAHLFEHLMAQGTKSLKPREISHLIESNGGVRNAYTMRSNTTYHSVVPKSALKTVLWAESERMSKLNVDELALADEQQVVLEEMRLRYVNQAYAKARDAGMAEAAFGKWENRHTTIGEAADVRNARLEDVRAFYQKHYAPNNAVLALAGDVTEAEARELAERFFGPLEAKPLAPAPDLTEPRMTGETRRVIDDKFAKVPLLMTGWNAPARGTKAYWALTLLGEILGAGEDSPLYRSLVKDAKIALSVSTNFPWWTGPFNPGGPELFGLMTALKGASADEALRLTDAVLAKLAAEGPSDEQLAAAKTSVELSWTKDLEQLIERAKTAGSYAAMVGNPEDLSRDFADLMSVTVADVKAALGEWIVGKGRAVVEARPAPGLVLPVDPATPPKPTRAPRPEGDPRPEIDPQPAFKVPAIERFTLSNGLKVAFVRDSRLPILEARLSLGAGRVSERPGEDGLSAAAAELLMQGAAGKDARALSAAFAGLGWKLDVSRGLESLSIDGAGLSRNSAAFFKELANVLATATYPEDEVALWKENKVEELKMQRAKPDFMASERMKAELFGASHPYGKPALEDGQIGAITRDAIAAYAQRAYVPGGATLVLTGDADPAALRAQLEAAFAGWNGAAAAAAVPALPAQGAARTALVDRAGSKQANLTVSQAIDLKPTDPDYLAFTVMNQILGGSATSRLFVNLRVKNSYTYGAYSRPQALEKGVLWTATAEVRNEVAAAALAEMRKEIAGMRDELVPEAQLAAVKKYLAGLFLLKLSSIDYAADSLANYERNKQSAERELASYVERLNALTPEDLQRVARKYLDPEKMVTVVVGDEAALAPQLTPAPR